MNKTKRIDRPKRKSCRNCERWTEWETDWNVGTCDFDKGMSSHDFSCFAWVKKTERKGKE